jgi:hypothetical protein
MTRLFKLATISANPVQVGGNPDSQTLAHELVFIAQDGETWTAYREEVEDLFIGQMFEFELIDAEGGDAPVPNFGLMGCLFCKKMRKKSPAKMLEQLWGNAASHINAEAPPKFVGTVFSPDHFHDIQNGDDAEMKAYFANNFIKFVNSSFGIVHYNPDFYNRLTMMFGFKAAKNRDEFYARYFATAQGRAQFMEQIASFLAAGDPHYCYCDVERALRAWVVQKQLKKFVKTATTAEATRDRAFVIAWLTKHGLPDVFKMPGQ